MEAAITVTDLNEAPTVPGKVSVTTDEDTPSAPVTIAAVDLDGDAISFAVQPGSGPAKGSVAIGGATDSVDCGRWTS